MDDFKIRIIHDLKSGATKFGNGTVRSDVPYEVNKFPDLFIEGSSFEIEFIIYQDQANDKAADLSSSICTLYGRPLGSGIDKLSLGSASGAATGRVTITIAKDTIPATWATFETIGLLLDCVGAAERIQLYQGVEIIAPMESTSEGAVSSSDYKLWTATLTTNTTLSGVVGRRLYYLDSSGGAFTVDLPTPGANAGQQIEFLHVDGSDSVNINPGTYEIDGSTDDIVTLPNDAYDLREYVPTVGAARWRNFKPSILV